MTTEGSEWCLETQSIARDCRVLLRTVILCIDDILALLSDPLGAAHRRRSDSHQLTSETTLDGNIEREIMIEHQGVVTLA